MSLFSNLVSGAAGYAVSEMSKSHPVRDFVDEKFNKHVAKKNLRDIVREYAEARGIYTTDDELAHELHKIASTYESYNYPY